MKVLSLSILILLYCTKLTGQICECPSNRKATLRLTDYTSAQINQNFLVCFTNDTSYSKNGVFVSFHRETFTVVNCKNGTRLEERNVTGKIYADQDILMIEYGLPFPRLWTRERLVQFEGGNVIQKSLAPEKTTFEEKFVLSYERIDKPRILELKKKFNQALTDIIENETSTFIYWEHARNLAICALNGDTESETILKRYPDMFKIKKGKIKYMLSGNRPNSLDLEYLENLKTIIQYRKYYPDT